MRRQLAVFLCFLGTLTAIGLQPEQLRADGKRTAVIVQCPGWCPAVAGSIRNTGGDVSFEYENVEAIAASVPEDKLADVSALVGARSVWKDVIVEQPVPIESPGGVPSKGATAVTLDPSGAEALGDGDGAVAQYVSALPTDYNYNNSLIRAAALHAAGKLGQDIVTAVVDTGTANAPVVPALAGTLIGGENFVTTDPVQSATSRRNAAHGTQVGTVIAGHANFVFSNTSRLVQSLKIHAPASVMPCPGPPFVAPCSATASLVPMIGTAPASRIYALKVFSSTGGGAPISRIVAAMDRAITLRKNFNKGVPSVPVSGDGSEENPFTYNSLKIDVVNMSLGGPTLFAGRELDEQLTTTMLKAGITNVIAAGNEGFGAMTASSPGDGMGALGVAAANTAVHERVLRDLQFGVGIGALYRPSPGTQTADFSSRGPTAGGRFKPDMIANGFATFMQGTCQGNAGCLAGTGLAPTSLASGTSFSTPVVAGAAALLRREVPTASATKVRNALVGSADPTLLSDGSGLIDQGRGFLDVTAALALLSSGRVSSHLAGSDPEESVRENIAEIGFRAIKFSDDQFTAHVSNLVPGQVAQFFVPTRITTSRIKVTLQHITPENDPAHQNQLFGDDILLTVLDAPTSVARTRVSQFVSADKTFTFDNVQPGLMRVALQGDWTNAGRVSADVVIARERSDPGEASAEGKVGQGGNVTYSIVVPAGAKTLAFDLSWEADWSRYPTNDLDLLVQNPAGVVDAGGSTLDSPERVSIANPAAGTWVVTVNGFTVHAGIDDGDHEDHGDHDHDHHRARLEEFELRVTIDGTRLRLPGTRKSHD